jgi:ketosteroid isomerase-like protein
MASSKRANVEIVRSIYERWGRGETALELMSEDVVWDFSRRQVERETD